MEQFLRVRESKLRGFAEPQPLVSLQYILAHQLRKSKRLDLDMHIYDRVELVGGPEFTYAFLLKRLRAVIDKAREERARQQKVESLRRAGSGGDTAFAANPNAKAKP